MFDVETHDFGHRRIAGDAGPPAPGRGGQPKHLRCLRLRDMRRSRVRLCVETHGGDGDVDLVVVGHGVDRIGGCFAVFSWICVGFDVYFTLCVKARHGSSAMKNPWQVILVSPVSSGCGSKTNSPSLATQACVTSLLRLVFPETSCHKPSIP